MDIIHNHQKSSFWREKFRMINPENRFSDFATRSIRRYLVGPEQSWVFASPPKNWFPPKVKRTSLYLHVPFCRNFCPYCPYLKVPYDETLLAPYTLAAITEVDWWADRVGQSEITSIYIGGGTPTIALDSISSILNHVRERFHVTGEVCIETNPVDVSEAVIQSLKRADIQLISLGVQSFQPKHLTFLSRRYTPATAEKALDLLAQSDFGSINVDLMFALPSQESSEVISDICTAVQLGAKQITAYPLFTFPYTSIGKYLRLKNVQMPRFDLRKAHYQAINHWCRAHGFQRASVWSFKKEAVPRYSSVTRDSYIGVGPGAGSHLPGEFLINTFDLPNWLQATQNKRTAVALRMPFTEQMSSWWWLYWRFYDTIIPLKSLDTVLGRETPKALRLLRGLELLRLVDRKGNYIELTEAGAFWLHLIQNHFALNYVNKVWTRANEEAWPQAVKI